VFIRVDHAGYLLRAARSNADRAASEEVDASAADAQWSEDALAYSMAAVAMAAAYVEATINEVFERASDEVRWRMQTGDLSMPRRLGERLAVYWSATDGGRGLNPLVRFDAALRLAGAPLLDRSRSPYQDVELLFRLRNWIMHNKSEFYVVGTGTPSNWETALSGRFTLPAPMSSEGRLMPLNAFGSACAHWACEHAEAFVGEFEEAFSKRGADWTP
ncbi:MAG: hypothetical protein A2Z12_09480, partial [Actinobacteria bacterium RBG_16_68_21]